MMVESLIMCRRYADALERCKTLLPGPDRDYLQVIQNGVCLAYKRLLDVVNDCACCAEARSVRRDSLSMSKSPTAQAEALWRSGRVEEAAEVLAAHPEVPKCWSLAADLGYVAGVVREAEAAVEEQRWADAEDACWLLCSWDGLSGSKGRDGEGLRLRFTCAARLVRGP